MKNKILILTLLLAGCGDEPLQVPPFSDPGEPVCYTNSINIEQVGAPAWVIEVLNITGCCDNFTISASLRNYQGSDLFRIRYQHFDENGQLINQDATGFRTTRNVTVSIPGEVIVNQSVENISKIDCGHSLRLYFDVGNSSNDIYRTSKVVEISCKTIHCGEFTIYPPPPIGTDVDLGPESLPTDPEYVDERLQEIITEKGKELGRWYSRKVIKNPFVKNYYQFIRGDVDRNGLINIIDLFMLSRIVENEADYDGDCEDSLDINNDSFIDIADVMILSKVLFEEAPPPSEWGLLTDDFDAELDSSQFDQLECYSDQ